MANRIAFLKNHILVFTVTEVAGGGNGFNQR